MKIPQKARDLMSHLDHNNPKVKEMLESGEMDDFFENVTSQIQELNKKGPRAVTDIFNQLKTIFPEYDYFKVEFAEVSQEEAKVFELVLKYGSTAEFDNKDDRFDLLCEYFYTVWLLRKGYLKNSNDYALNIKRQAFSALKKLQIKIKLNPNLAKGALFNHFLATGEVVKFDN